MVTQFLAAAMPATAAAVSIALVLMTVLMAWLVAFCIRMMSGPAALLTAAPAAPATNGRQTVEEWTYPDGTVRRVIHWEAAR